MNFIKLNIRGDWVFINTAHLVSIERGASYVAFQCLDRVYSVLIDEDMTAEELEDIINSITNTYVINESNSNIG